MPAAEAADWWAGSDWQVNGWCVLPSPAPWEHLRAVADGHGARDLLRRSPEVAAWAAAVQPLAVALLGPVATPISALWFDKLPRANWHVPWHQDLFAPAPRFSAPGWERWSEKEGVPYAELPEPWCSRRLALRLHLDDCTAEHGPLQVIPGSHRLGKLSEERVLQVAAAGPVATLLPRAGEVLALDPLLLHRSSPAIRPGHRRVVHVEWCDVPLPGGARWLDGPR